MDGKELDFDELDKAVNSVMTGTKDNTVNESASESQTAVSVAAPSPSSSDSAPAAGSLATKRSGRFMDVIPNGTQNKSASSSRPSRQGVTLSPLNDDKADEAPAEVAELETALTGLDTASTLTQAPETTEKTSPWPDPIDVHPSSQSDTNTEEKAPEQAESSSSTEGGDTDAPASEPADLTPAESPFLPDAKVEKRPLGSPNPDLKVDDAPASDTAPAAEEPAEPQELPAELGEDVLAIEADANTSAQQEKSQVDIATEPAAASPSASVPEGASATALSAASITQQYKIAPSTRDQSHAALYDTAAQPLQHPAKKKSGWTTLIIIVLLIILGAGGGAALYYFKLI